MICLQLCSLLLHLYIDISLSAFIFRRFWRETAAKTAKIRFGGEDIRCTQNVPSGVPAWVTIWVGGSPNKNWPSKPPGGDEQMVSIFGIILCLSFSQSRRQTGENRVWGGTAYPKRTQGYTSVDSGLSKWSAKIKIGQANRLEVMNNGFYFWDHPMS